jgi:hypothetical protein
MFTVNGWVLGVGVFVDNTTIGAILADYHVAPVLTAIDTAHFWLINFDGYWLAGGGDKDFAFQTNDPSSSRQSFASLFPNEWQTFHSEQLEETAPDWIGENDDEDNDHHNDDDDENSAKNHEAATDTAQTDVRQIGGGFAESHHVFTSNGLFIYSHVCLKFVVQLGTTRNAGSCPDEPTLRPILVQFVPNDQLTPDTDRLAFILWTTTAVALSIWAIMSLLLTRSQIARVRAEGHSLYARRLAEQALTTQRYFPPYNRVPVPSLSLNI